MSRTILASIIILIPTIIVWGAIIYFFILVVKALKKYINSKPIREEKSLVTKSLGEVIKTYRTENKMTQEFVAEHLGVSRQAVSKWESGTSDPSTSNLLALSKLFNVPAEELLRETKEKM